MTKPFKEYYERTLIGFFIDIQVLNLHATGYKGNELLEDI